jgi:hypothetical protein
MWCLNTSLGTTRWPSCQRPSGFTPLLATQLLGAAVVSQRPVCFRRVWIFRWKLGHVACACRCYWRLGKVLPLPDRFTVRVSILYPTRHLLLCLNRVGLQRGQLCDAQSAGIVSRSLGTVPASGPGGLQPHRFFGSIYGPNGISATGDCEDCSLLRDSEVK